MRSPRYSSLFKTGRIIFTPSVDLKDELANTAIQITCIDRNGKEVKRVTSTSGDVEDPENENSSTGSEQGNTGGGNNNGGGTGGNNNTGGSYDGVDGDM